MGWRKRSSPPTPEAIHTLLRLVLQQSRICGNCWEPSVWGAPCLLAHRNPIIQRVTVTIQYGRRSNFFFFISYDLLRSHRFPQWFYNVRFVDVQFVPDYDEHYWTLLDFQGISLTLRHWYLKLQVTDRRMYWVAPLNLLHWMLPTQNVNDIQYNAMIPARDENASAVFLFRSFRQPSTCETPLWTVLW